MASNRLSTTIKKIKAIAIVQQIFGWIITIFCAMITLTGLSSGSMEAINIVIIIIFTIFTALGIILITKGSKRKKAYNKIL